MLSPSPKAKEYPDNFPRFYEWTPDECIPEFFDDPAVLARLSAAEDAPYGCCTEGSRLCCVSQVSLHPPSVMTDIKLPEWANTPEMFIRWHRFAPSVLCLPDCDARHSQQPPQSRQMLESAEVSRDLHTWIDLNFGCALGGPTAVAAKNVAMPLCHLGVDERCTATLRRVDKAPGFVQLFRLPHPRRAPGAASPAKWPPAATPEHASSELEAEQSTVLEKSLNVRVVSVG